MALPRTVADRSLRNLEEAADRSIGLAGRHERVIDDSSHSVHPTRDRHLPRMTVDEDAAASNPRPAPGSKPRGIDVSKLSPAERSAHVANLIATIKALENLPDDIPQQERREIDEFMGPDENEPAWIKTVRNMHDAAAALEEMGVKKTKLGTVMKNLKESGQASEAIQRSFDNAEKLCIAVQNPSTVARLHRLLTNYKLFCELAGLKLEEVDEWSVKLLSKYMLPYLAFIVEHGVGRRGDKIKAATVKQHVSTIAMGIIRFACDPANESKRSVGMELLRSGFWSALENLGKNMVFTWKLDRTRKKAIYMGKWEVSLLNEEALRRSAHSGPQRESRVQQIVFWNGALLTATRPGAFAASVKFYRDRGQTFNWEHVELIRLSANTYECRLNLVNIKGGNMTYEARELLFVLGPVLFPENVIFDFALWMVIWAFISGQLHPKFKTIEDVLNDTSRTLKFQYPKRAVFCEARAGGNGVNFEKAATTAPFREATLEIGRAVGMIEAALSMIRRDGADAYETKCGKGMGSLGLGHRISVFNTSYSRNMANLPLTNIRLGELVDYDTVASRAREALHHLDSPAVLAVVQRWVMGRNVQQHKEENGIGKEISEIGRNGRAAYTRAPVTQEEKMKKTQDGHDDVVSATRRVELACKKLLACVPEGFTTKGISSLQQHPNLGQVSSNTTTPVIKSLRRKIEDAAGLQNLGVAAELCKKALTGRGNARRSARRAVLIEQEHDDRLTAEEAAKNADSSLYEKAGEAVTAPGKHMAAILDAVEEDVAGASAPAKRVGRSPEGADFEVESDDDRLDEDEERVQRMGTAWTKKVKGKEGKGKDREADEDQAADLAPGLLVEEPTDVPAKTGIELSKTALVRRALAIEVMRPIMQGRADAEVMKRNDGLLPCDRCAKFKVPSMRSNKKIKCRGDLAYHMRHFHTPWKDRAIYVVKEEDASGGDVWKCPFRGCEGAREGYATFKQVESHFISGDCIQNDFWVRAYTYDRAKPEDRQSLLDLLEQLVMSDRDRNIEAMMAAALEGDERVMSSDIEILKQEIREPFIKNITSDRLELAEALCGETSAAGEGSAPSIAWDALHQRVYDRQPAAAIASLPQVLSGASIDLDGEPSDDIQTISRRLAEVREERAEVEAKKAAARDELDAALKALADSL